jgi:SAM-dependent methyltransferase
MTTKEDVARYFECVAREKRTFSPRYTNFIFDGIDFRHRNVLDIGGGAGLLSFYAAIMGADKVICIEPEAKGSEVNIRGVFGRLASSLGLSNVELCTNTFQDFDWTGATFDIVVMNDSLNHLDEQACITLDKSDESQRVYRGMFEKMLSLMTPGGIVVVTECDRNNVFPLLGFTNPFSTTIEWHKHQSPYLWRELMESVGFVDPEMCWEYPLRLVDLGRLFMSNRFSAFFYQSRFLLRMRKPSA